MQAEMGAVQSWGQFDTVQECVKKLNLEKEWHPYGYKLKYIFISGKNMTAYLYRVEQTDFSNH